MRSILLVAAVLLIFSWSVVAQKLDIDPRTYTFEEYVVDFKKPYTEGTAEWQLRERIFLDNLKKIVSHNDEPGVTWTMGVNDFTDLTPQEMKSRMGFRPRPKAPIDPSHYTFNQYVNDFRKPYHHGTAEWAKRKRIFEDNVRMILAHNAQPGVTWTMGINDFTDLTSQEMRNQHTGFVDTKGKVDPAHYTFEQFVQDYGRPYERGTPEYQYRREIFYANLRQIIAHNSEPGVTWTAGINNFTDLTSQEMRDHHMGLTPEQKRKIDPTRYTFEQYVRDFAKPYVPGTAEFDRRREIFDANLRWIVAHNAQPGPTWTAGINEFTDRTSEEMRYRHPS